VDVGPRESAILVVQRAYDSPMAESYPCPRCGDDVPTTLAASGSPTANVQHQQCPRCGALLERPLNIPDKSWRLDKSRQQPPWEG
jgi:hypothetical protein